MALTHHHTCLHCDRIWPCTLVHCGFQYDVSKYHDCRERELYARRMRRMLADYPKCPRGCKVLPCVHDRFADKTRPRGRKLEHEYGRPPVRQLAPGVYEVECQENGHTQTLLDKQSEQRQASYRETKDEPPAEVTSYLVDGKANLSRAAQRVWVNNKIDAIAEQYPVWLRGLIKEHRK